MDKCKVRKLRRLLASGERLASAARKTGMDRVRELLRKHAQRPAAEISDIIRDTLADFRGPAGQDDDLTFVIAKVI